MVRADHQGTVEGHCHKCGGFLVVERLLDFYGPMSGWKCINCGWSRRVSPQSELYADGRATKSRLDSAGTIKGAMS